MFIYEHEQLMLDGNPGPYIVPVESDELQFVLPLIPLVVVHIFVPEHVAEPLGPLT